MYSRNAFETSVSQHISVIVIGQTLVHVVLTRQFVRRVCSDVESLISQYQFQVLDVERSPLDSTFQKSLEQIWDWFTELVG